MVPSDSLLYIVLCSEKTHSNRLDVVQKFRDEILLDSFGFQHNLLLFFQFLVEPNSENVYYKSVSKVSNPSIEPASKVSIPKNWYRLIASNVAQRHYLPNKLKLVARSKILVVQNPILKFSKFSYFLFAVISVIEAQFFQKFQDGGRKTRLSATILDFKK
jgi:hypothetical protein